MGGKASRQTPADRRLKANRATAKPASTSTSTAKPKFGSPAWDAKYGVGRGKKK